MEAIEAEGLVRGERANVRGAVGKCCSTAVTISSGKECGGTSLMVVPVC